MPAGAQSSYGSSGVFTDSNAETGAIVKKAADSTTDLASPSGRPSARKGKKSNIFSFFTACLRWKESAPQYVTELPKAIKENWLLPELPDLILSKIGNGLDAKSCMALASSCQKFYNFFRQPSNINGVRIPLVVEQLIQINRHFIAHSERGSRPLEDMDLENYVDGLRQWPFVVHIQKLNIDYREVHLARDLLHRMNVGTIFEILHETLDYKDLEKLIDDYSIKKVDFGNDEWKYKALESLRSVHTYLITSPAWLFDVEIPRLSIERPSANTAILNVVLKKFLTTNTLVCWKLAHRMNMSDLFSIFNNIPLYHVDHTGPLPDVKPRVVHQGVGGHDISFHLLREDGRVVHVEHVHIDEDWYEVVFSFCATADCPEILFRT